MATIVPVHGTFAHVPSAASDTVQASSEQQWWEPGSSFEADLGRWVEGRDGPIHFAPFVWDGENSEQSRRLAGKALMDVAVHMEADGEPYVLLGHSHGGSVIAAALQSAVARRKRLERLTRWISVGTPFVNMRKEVFLFSRIPLVLQAIYVALLLFVVMFLVPMALGLAAGEDTRSRYMGQFGLADLGSLDGIATLGITTLAVSSVFILFYVFLRLMDRRMLHMYARGNIARAREQYGPKWLGLTHEDDEVVQGLRSLGSTRFHIFDKSFHGVGGVRVASRLCRAAVLSRRDVRADRVSQDQCLPLSGQQQRDCESQGTPR